MYLQQANVGLDGLGDADVSSDGPDDRVDEGRMLESILWISFGRILRIKRKCKYNMINVVFFAF
jgi:hypothetical protein